MPQPVLHGLDVHAIGDELGGLGVAQLVELEAAEPVVGAEGAPLAAEVGEPEVLGLVGAADCRVVALTQPQQGHLFCLEGPSPCEVRYGLGVDADASLACVALGVLDLPVRRDGLLDMDCPSLEVDALPLQRDDLSAAHSRREPYAGCDDVANGGEPAQVVAP